MEAPVEQKMSCPCKNMEQQEEKLQQSETDYYKLLQCCTEMRNIIITPNAEF
jgi:hypothetical protein